MNQAQPVSITVDNFEDAYRVAKIRVQGMRDADPVNVYEVAAVEVSSVGGNRAVLNGAMFELDAAIEGVE